MPPSDEASLSTLTGVRSGKNSYYVELRRTGERMTSAVRALEGISSALVRTRDDPRQLLRAVLPLRRQLLRVRFVLRGQPFALRLQLQAARTRIFDGFELCSRLREERQHFVNRCAVLALQLVERFEP